MYLKRIIGLPGETVAFVDGAVLINGQALDEPYEKYRLRLGPASGQTRPERIFCRRRQSYDAGGISRVWKSRARSYRRQGRSMKIAFRVVLLAALAALGVWLWTILFPSPQKIIRQRLEAVARTRLVFAG